MYDGWAFGSSVVFRTYPREMAVSAGELFCGGALASVKQFDQL